jgi:hypothetical protein
MPQKTGMSRRTIMTIVGIVVVILIAAGGWFFSRDQPTNAKAGDCISGQTAESMKIVACTDAKATNKVVGRVDGKTLDDFNTKLAEICQPYPSAVTGFWQGKKGQKGPVLCLEPIKK